MTCTRFIFDRGGCGPYYTRPMAAGLPDLVDCARLAEDAAVIERVYGLSELPRLQDVLAEGAGRLTARFAFSRAASGRAAARIAIRATPQLLCQRCMQGFAFPVSGGSEIEFSDDEEAAGSSMGQELYVMNAGRVSLRELAEEELLLALPLAPACSAPQDCGHAPILVADVDAPEPAGEMRRPFSALQDLLKKT
jgi:uncharacterized protein